MNIVKCSDFEIIYPLLKELWPGKRLNKEKLKKVFDKELKLGKEFLIAVLDKPVGFVSLTHTYQFFSEGRIGIIDELVVSKEYRGKGIGTKLLKTVHSHAKKLGCRDVTLHSALYRKKAHKFYISHGYNKSAYHFEKRL